MSCSDPIYIGVSRCLLGDEVRYDAGHKRDALLLGILGPHVEWVPVCPEVEMGMGIPREPIQLVARSDGVPSAGERVRLVAVRSRHDWTESMRAWARKRTRALAGMQLSGYVLKKDSPSCGMDWVRVHRGAGRARGAGGAGGAWQVTRTGRGLFAQALMDALPNLPVEDEERLQDAALRDNFIERLFAYRRVRRLFAGRWTAGALVRFHTAHKLQLLAHSRRGYTDLGRLVANGTQSPRGELSTRYESMFMNTLRKRATPAGHTDVLQRMAGHLERLIDSCDRNEIHMAIDGLRGGALPLGVPLALIRGHVRRCNVEYLAGQTYLHPDPREMSLRGV